MNLEEKEVIDKLIKNAEQTAGRYTHPIFTVGHNSKPDLIGTSVIIELDNKIYLLTAAHVLTSAASMNIIAIGLEGKITPISTEWFFAEQLDGVEFDVAFTELSAELAAEVEALPSSNLLHTEPNQGEHFCLVNGYPSSKNKPSKALRQPSKYASKSYSFVSYLNYDFDQWDDVNKDPEWHYCSAHGRKQGNQAPLKPNGLSGGGLWVIPNIAEPKLYLAGVYIEHYTHKKVSFSTRIDKVIETIILKRPNRVAGGI
ncbi:hypothetical protein [Shewanella morhuae]|uniref:V8-like Glu-specific endopeptidase n=1 Tax=Shewanella morhuae TaxID=365591 RepID=A0A379ZCB7_9GAMM|nr:hypothetical protein [Shewanella morhuae]SUI59185.1 Uncharacterised protein [Shewanella morhuae]